MAQFPALTLWTDAYLSDTRHLSTLEHGAYLLLLMEAWRRPNCDLPDDDRFLARLAGVGTNEWADIKPVVMEFWTRDGRSKTWKQKRLSKERDAAKKRSKSQKDNSAKRWNKTEKVDSVGYAKKSHGNPSTATATATAIDEEANASPSFLEPDGSRPADAEPSLRPEHVVEKWNEIAGSMGKPRVRDLTPERRQLVKARISQYSLADFATVFANIRGSPFLRGDTGKHFCTFDWAMKKANFQKIIEGNYNGQSA